MTVTAITPTCGRPQAFALLESYVRRQTRQPDQWIVVDGGRLRATPTMGQDYFHNPEPPGWANFLTNVSVGLQWAWGDVLVFLEDDDWIDARHIERVVGLLEALTASVAVGDSVLRYYHLPSAHWRVMQNGSGSALCQTAVRRTEIPALLRAIETCRTRRTYGVDALYWLHAAKTIRTRLDTVVGLKGLPGQAGLGIGHRPRAGWTADPGGLVLKSWIGSDAEAYRSFGAIV